MKKMYQINYVQQWLDDQISYQEMIELAKKDVNTIEGVSNGTAHTD